MSIYVLIFVATVKPKKDDEEKPAWKREADIVTEEQFDEEAYLKGRMSIGVECSVDKAVPSKKGVSIILYRLIEDFSFVRGFLRAESLLFR